MSKKIPWSAAAALMLLAVLITFQITYLSVHNKYEHLLNTVEAAPGSNAYSKLSNVDELFRSLYVGEINESELIDAVIRGYLQGTGDSYAAYMNSEEFAAFVKNNSGELAGIGVIILNNTEYKALEVVMVTPGSPALEAGVQSGDLIIEVNGVDVSLLGYNAAVAQMQGEAGTSVNFTVARGENYSERKQFSIERGVVPGISVMAHSYETDGVAYGVIKILQFDHNTIEQLQSAVVEMQGKGIQRLIFDVRSNSGGSASSVAQALDYLLPEGPVARVIDSAGTEETLVSEAGEVDVPMAVLINGKTAGMSELFAAALRDYDKAVLVGEKTFGKGSVQTIVRLADNSAISMTYKIYNPPYSDSYDGVGVSPDIEAVLPSELASVSIYQLEDGEDTQLLAAIQSLSGLKNGNE